ncbi:MAG: 1,4-alpha-glucan branching protein GlgB [Candidatus Sericytochromatia bacterium]|nr:1,4-alpha-glucan branching protein GlgB [Candidatus Sericytochromatia bacterium]
MSEFAPALPTVTVAEVHSLLAQNHSNPHAVLGPHLDWRGLTIRAYFPEAVHAVVIPDEGEPQAMTACQPEGFFEALFPGLTAPFPYQLEIHYPHGDTHTMHDAYAFGPTLGEVDLHLFSEGRHERIFDKFGAHRRTVDGVMGTAFAIWVPGATGVSVVGTFNSWDGRLHPMRCLSNSGVWELFIPDVWPGALYKFEIRTQDGRRLMHNDPYARQSELPPGTASRVYEPGQPFRDGQWMSRRKAMSMRDKPVSIYEVHVGSWRRLLEESNRPLQYQELAHQLADYVLDMGFTHVELLPVMEHPFGGSWGYQVSGYFAPTARYGSPDDFRFLVNHLHERGIGVILDWVPAHFPKDEFALARLNGSAVYEHPDPRKGEHPDWGTYVFDYGRHEVKNFLIGNAMHWLEGYHVDGLRVDACASMLYLDYSRKDGQWIPNTYGGRENLDVVAMLQELNGLVKLRTPGVMMIAEESTAFPGVTHSTDDGGLGFGFKWNMGWMNDTLTYFQMDPLFRANNHGKLTFGLMYAWSETFVLPISHDEVVHGKGSMLNKMPGDVWQKFANLRALYAWMWAHPGKKLMFMGCEFGQWAEWNHDTSLDWHLLWHNEHRALQSLVRDLNHLYQSESALWADADPAGFQWIDPDNAAANVLAFLRKDPATGRQLICIGNFSPIVHAGFRIGLPRAGRYEERLNTDSQLYGGSNIGNDGGITAEEIPWDRQPYSAMINLPPLAMVWFLAPDAPAPVTEAELPTDEVVVGPVASVMVPVDAAEPVVFIPAPQAAAVTPAARPNLPAHGKAKHKSKQKR